MEISILIILVALFQYLILTLKVGTTRGKYGVMAPKTIGNDTWERLFRVQQNTLEQLIIFIPAMIIFAYFVNPTWVALPGILFLIGRQLYFIKYLQDPKTRTVGFALTFFSNVGLVLVSLGFIIWHMFA